MINRMRYLFEGQSLARILMNESLSRETLRGRVIDVGGGHHPDYFNFLQHEGEISLESVDASFSGINFEEDPLPFEDSYADTVLLCNVLEHIYEHKFLMHQVHRVLKKGGKLIGFVPFMIGYHPDPHDYFRYTKEALLRICKDAGFRDIKITEVGGGPFCSNFNTIVLSMPHVLRAALFPFYWMLDRIFLLFRPTSRSRYPLGYLFTALH